jgi:hypothetical protein
MNKSFLNHYSTTVKQALDQYGNDVISSIIIVRTPLAKAIDAIINIGSLGKSNKLKSKENYDNLFHLNVLINGKYTLEKNEIINFQKGDTRTDKSETMDVNPIPSGLSINMLLSNTKKKQGAKYYRYSASSNNCQDFISAMFSSNGMADSRYIEFIKQDTESIFKNNATLRKIANNATDAAAIGNIAYSKATTKVKGAVKKVKKFLGGAEVKVNYKKMKVAELKLIIKANKKRYNRKVTVSGKRKNELIALIEELN